MIESVVTENIVTNPEYYALLDLPSDEDYKSLKKSIETSGQQIPIEVVKDNPLVSLMSLPLNFSFNISESSIMFFTVVVLFSFSILISFGTFRSFLSRLFFQLSCCNLSLEVVQSHLACMHPSFSCYV